MSDPWALAAETQHLRAEIAEAKVEALQEALRRARTIAENAPDALDGPSLVAWWKELLAALSASEGQK